MKNIFRIFISDAKRIKTNVVAVVIVLGLSILPCLYAWFNILSNWDPYGPEATANIKVAVASDDKGITIDDMTFNIGDEVLAALSENDSVGWVFTETTEEAVEGVYSGDYYAALTIPEDFSADMVSFLTDELTHPEISYYCNEKKNAIAPKITDKVRNTVQLQLNNTFISIIVQAVTEVSGTLMDSDVLQEETGSSSLLDVLIAKFEAADAQLSVYEDLMSSLIAVFGNAAGTTEDFEAVYPDMSDALISGKSAMNSLRNATDTGLGTITGVSEGLSATFSGIGSALDSIASALNKANGNVADFTTVLSAADVSLQGTKDGIIDMREVIAERLEVLNELKSKDSYALLQGLLTNDPEEIGSFLASPVTIETEAIYPVANYGSAMASFYTVLALWVGALILVAIIHVKVHTEPSFSDAKPYQQYFGRYIVFFLISQIQALITTLGNIFYLEIQCEHPGLFWLAASVSSFVFSIFIYSLTVAMGNIGEGIAVIVMVIQVAGAGGTFPIETLPKVYQMIYKYLPFTYAMNAMREAVAGVYQDEFLKDIMALLVYVLISLFIGLILAIPFRKLNVIIEKSKKASGVML